MDKFRLSAFLTLFFLFNTANAQCVFEVDFHDWVQEGFESYGTWTVAADGLSVVQSENANPTFFVSQDTFMNVRLYGQIEVGWNGDNDFVGFVFGYHSPNTNTSNNQYEFYLFDWKKDYQALGWTYCNSVGDEGFTLAKYNTSIPDDPCNVYLNFWQHDPDPPKVEILGKDYGNTLGWNYDQVYNFELTYTSTKIIVSVNSDTIFNVDGCYEPGRFGFYNFSQEAVTYSNFNYALATEFTVEGAPDYWLCDGDVANYESVDLSCAGFPANIVSWDWDLGDGNTSTEVNPSHTYADVGVYEVKLVMTDYLTCQDSMTHMVHVKPLPVVMDSLTTDTNYFCDNYPQPLELVAHGGSGDSVVWYTGSCGSGKIGVGDTIYPPAPTDTLTYYARYEGFCGTSDCDTLIAFVHLSAVEPDSVTVNYNSYCKGTYDSLLLRVYGGWGDTISWFSESCGGIFLGYGDSLTVASPEDTTYYYARWQNSCSNSNCADLELIIYPLPEPVISGISPVCGFTSGETYATTNNLGWAHTYSWEFYNATPISATNLPSVTVDFPDGPNTAHLIVLEVNHLSCEQRDTMEVIIHPKPAPIGIYHD